MKDRAGTQVMLAVDGRMRVTLGKLATCAQYLANVEGDGTIVLTPAVIVPLAVVRQAQSAVVEMEVNRERLGL